jgi:hypothetical protein
MALRLTQLPVKYIPAFFPGLKQVGRGVKYPPPCSAEIKERVELCFYSPSRSSRPVLGPTLLFFSLFLLPELFFISEL